MYRRKIITESLGRALREPIALGAVVIGLSLGLLGHATFASALPRVPGGEDPDPTEETVPTTRAPAPTTTVAATVAIRVVPHLPASSAAPTTGLGALSDTLTLKTKSVTTVVDAPANLAVPNRTEISVLFGTRRLSQIYDRARGNHFVFQFDANSGAERVENVTVSLAETTAPGTYATYALLWQTPIKPLYDVWISPLTFYQESECDWIGASEIEIVMHTSDHQRRTASFDSRAFATTVRGELAGYWHEVGLNTGLSVPTIDWEEDDIELPPYGFHAYAISAEPLLPYHSGLTRWKAQAYGQECSAWLSYQTLISVDTYSDL